MGKIKVTKCLIEGLYVIEPTVFVDNRGYFFETYNQNDMHEAGLDMTFVQENTSKSVKGVLRGLHFQKRYPQGKLARVLEGAVFDVAVDLRSESKTYGQWYGVELSDENKKQFYIPEGFAHGLLTLTDEAVFCYKCTDFYHPGDEGGIAWNDPELGIVWPGVTGMYPGNGCADGYLLDGKELILSEKDQNWLGLKATFRF
ncbi:MAG: dTDP-4-dehydrorhamnose 3,5-epimerase [Clostridiales bacterium]|nr:dTDP-4-dehydrorhamnose 3,5-epimerase [Clostridiales bacterium]